MNASTLQSAHRALLNLERNSAPPAELFDDAAKILGIAWSEIKDELFSTSAGTALGISAPFAPKEEWTLTWLLKKTKPTARTATTASESASSANHDPRKWLLFSYLVQKIPIKRTAKILRDQEAMQQIQHALLYLVEAQMKLPPASPTSRVRATTSPDFGNVDSAFPQAQTRKRKRSPTLEEPVNQDCPIVQVIFSVLRALQVCLNNASAADGDEVVAQQHMRVALSLVPKTSAAILGSIVHIVQVSLGS
jgi:hypothetical protein